MAVVYLSTREAAAHLNLSPRTLEKLRITGSGPAYRKFGRLVRYTEGDLHEWADRDVRTSTSQSGPEEAQ